MSIEEEIMLLRQGEAMALEMEEKLDCCRVCLWSLASEDNEELPKYVLGCWHCIVTEREQGNQEFIYLFIYFIERVRGRN